MKRVRNADSSSHVWCGQTVASGATYTIQAVELDRWAADDNFLADIASGLAVVGDGTIEYTSVSDAIAFIRDELARPVLLDNPFADPNGFRARFKGFSGTATKNSTTNVQFKLTEERYINGVRLILENHVLGDKVHFEVVDVDNILGYGAGAVLDRFGEDWFVDPDQKTQPDATVNYPAKILANLYIRVVYVSVGTVNDVSVKANLFLHKKT